MGPATVYRFSKEISFWLSVFFVLVQELDEKNYAAIRFWGRYALDSKMEKWRMSALDVEQL